MREKGERVRVLKEEEEKGEGGFCSKRTRASCHVVRSSREVALYFWKRTPKGLF